MNEGVNHKVNRSVYHKMNEYVNYKINERVNHKMNEYVNHEINKPEKISCLVFHATSRPWLSGQQLPRL